MTEIVELKVKTEKLEKRQLDYERQRELDAQVKKNTETPARSSARVILLLLNRKTLTKKKCSWTMKHARH